MVKTRPASPDSQVRDVLALCARPSLDEGDEDRLRRCLGGIADWPALEITAEAHGLGPLVYSRLESARLDVPTAARRAFHGLYLRHGRQNFLRLRALREILVALSEAGVFSLVLKGAALAHLIYARPGLRPMGDLDLLVSWSDLGPAQRTLESIGFVSIDLAGDRSPDKHILLLKDVDGLGVRVELHHRLFPSGLGGPPARGLRSGPLIPFTLDGLTAYTLDPDSLIWHLCQHLNFHADVFTRLRLIWIADLARLAESFLDRIDWERVGHDFPIVRNVLSLVEAVAPLSERVRVAARLPGGPYLAGGWADFRGWPRFAIGDRRQQGKSARGILRDTLLPSPWWLRLHYGLDRAHPLWWHRWIRHPLAAAGWASRLAGERVAAALPPRAGARRVRSRLP
ncbi:MAG: nucleotidyltransferase domain-containing protein [Chloroflexota bacterium]